MIQQVVGSVVGRSVGKWSVDGSSVGRWSVNLVKPRKNMFGLVILPLHFGRGLSCYSNFIFFYNDNK